MGNKLSKKLKKRSKHIDSITPPEFSKPNFTEIHDFHQELITDDSKRQIFKTHVHLEFVGRDKLSIIDVLEKKDYLYYPDRIEQLLKKIRMLGYRFNVSYYFGYPDEHTLLEITRTQKSKETKIAKSNSLNELKDKMKTFGPAIYHDGEYQIERLIWTNPIVLLDVEERLTSDSNPHSDNNHATWKDQKTMLGEHKIGNFEFFCLATGSDYELPTVYIVYLDIDGDIRGYVPIKGNAFNIESYDMEDYKNIYDWDKMKKDILTNIQVV